MYFICMKNFDFATSAVTENHSRIEAVLANALNDSRNPALLKPLFECLKLAVDDAHLSDKYSPSLIAAIASICRNCSGDRRKASIALSSLEAIYEKVNANIKAYAVDAACILGTPQALRFVLRAAEDSQVLKRCEDIDDHIDHMVGLIYAADPLSSLRELGRMLSHPAYEVRFYAANRLLLFGEPGQPERLAEAAHNILAEGVRGGCAEARGLLRHGYRLAEFQEEWPHGFRKEKMARAACSFYQRVKKGGECAIDDACWRGIRPQVIEGGEFQRPNRRRKNEPPRDAKRPELRVIRDENPARARG